MRILHIVEAWKGGIASYLKALITAQIDDGNIVFLAADADVLGEDARMLECAVKNYSVSRRLTNLPKIRTKLKRIVREANPDVVHAHSTFPGVFARFPRRLHQNIIYTAHGWAFLKRDVSPLARRVYCAVEARLARQASAVVCLSFDEIRSALSAGLPARKLSLIHTGIVDRPLELEGGVPSAPAGCGGLVVGFFGRTDYQKGADLLVEVADRIATASIIHIFGEQVRGRSIIADHERIRKHGWLPNEEVHHRMRQMDLIIIPSRWEGFCITALEALRAGVPIIVPAGTSLTEVVVHGYNGLIMREYSARHLAELIDSLSVTECRRMGANARRIFEETFTFDHFYKRMMELYDRVLKEPAR